MRLISTAILIGSATAAPAQQAPAVPIRALAPVSAKTTTPLRAVLGTVTQLPGGTLLVNDYGARRLLLFDSTLTAAKVLRDSAAGFANSYGPRAAFVIPHVADSTLFVEIASQTMVVVDPRGGFGRVMAPPNPHDLPLLARPGPGVDSRGRLIYEGTFPRIGSPGAQDEMVAYPDSAPMLRADPESRTIDTIARVKVMARPRQITTIVAGKRHVRSIVNPLSSVDGWAILADGTVALVRGHDYHIDWINVDGTTSSSPKLPFDWRRLTDDDKQKLIDSAAAAQRARDSVPASGSRGGTAGCIRIEDGRDVVVPCSSTSETTFVPLSEIPDYYPPLRSSAVRADADNNVWILPTTTAQSQRGELVYDVVNRKGELFERVRVPVGRSIAGFGRGGIVYLMWRDGTKGWFIERTHVVRSAPNRQ